MKRQLQGIALILVSILLMLGYGNVAFFDLSFKWALIFSVIGISVSDIASLPFRSGRQSAAQSRKGMESVLDP